MNEGHKHDIEFVETREDTAFALERLEQLDAHRLLYRLPKPRPDGRTQRLLSPLELIQRLAALVPPLVPQGEDRTVTARFGGVKRLYWYL